MSYKIDCLKNGSPYAIEIKELKYLYKKKISKKNLYYIFGYGENRYYFKINDKK